MALRCDASGDYMRRTTILPTVTAYTLMGWFQIVTDRNAYSCFMAYANAAGDATYYIGTAADGTTLISWNYTSDGPNGTNLVVGTWYHCALVCDGTGAGNLRVYLNGVLDSTHAGSPTANAGALWVGQNLYGDFLNGRGAAIKTYAAALTANELLNEMQYFVPIRTTNLNTWLPCIEPVANDNAIDFSGIGGNFTVNGTLTVEDGPPIVWAPVSEDVMGMAYDAAIAVNFQPYQPWQLRGPILAM